MPQPSKHTSPLVPSVQFQEGIEANSILPYVRNLVGQFFKAQEDIEDLSRIHHVQQEDLITEADWASREDERKVDFNYVYRVVMKEAQKRDGKISQMAYSLTFDRVLTPLQCETTDIHYGTMTLAERPILYYIRLDLADLIEKAREQDDLAEPESL
jgi:hypothetical protein